MKQLTKPKYMMAIQNLRILEKHKIVLLSQIGGKLQQEIIGSCWVLARKGDGPYLARCAAKGFSQIPEKDFQENHAPVVSDTKLHLLKVIKTMLKLEAG
jgi:hypothetical protein